MLKAAQRLERLDVRRARETYLDALTAALFAGTLTIGADAPGVAKAARSAPKSDAPRPMDFLLEGLAVMISEEIPAGIPLLKQALSAFRSETVSTDERLRWAWLAGRAAAFIWDYDSWEVLTAHQVQVARDAGALTTLPLALAARAGVHVWRGELALATSLVQEVEAIAEATNSNPVPYAALSVAALRGREVEGRELIETSSKDFRSRGEGMALSMAGCANATLCNGLAKYDDAFAAAQHVLQGPNELFFSPVAMIELIEAAGRIGKEAVAVAAPALARLVHITDASGTDWALAIQARCRALLSNSAKAEELYREAIDRLVQTPLRLDLARTHLAYGEWLRRERRQRDARQQLRLADGLFTEFGMEGFTERARVELSATGEHARKRSVETRSDLTPQEAQISRLVAQGATNQEIAAQLFISPSTVEYHLRKVFSKLAVKSRTQLAQRVLECTSRQSQRA
jgi:DNA-binding CsgD family transcriptional regulator